MMSRARLLIVDDEEFICKQLEWGFCDEYEVFVAYNTQDAVKKYQRIQPDVITLDINLSFTNEKENGFRVLEQILKIDPLAKVVMITGQNEKECGINSLQLGAFDYYLKPVDLNELKVILKRAIHIRSLEIENKQKNSSLPKHTDYYGIIGQSKKMKKLISLVQRVAKTDMTVLLLGESGTGKELVAQALHKCSKRAKNSFIPVDSGAIPATLLESELFGHERGAFTDAHFQRIGKVELANKGTLFLDEIAELPVNLQVKLLRFLQERKIQRIGKSELIPVDIRIVDATNKNLEKEMNKGNFREDMYYRLNEVIIELPPLREREDDIFLLTEYFLEKYSKELFIGLKMLSSASLEAMKNYRWPGNIRELENKIKRALVLSTDKYIRPEDLDIGYQKNRKDGLTLKEARESIEKELLLKNIKKFNWNLTKVSNSLGIARSTVYDLMEKYNLSHKSKRLMLEDI